MRLCKRGLHDIDKPENWYVIPSRGTGQCFPCQRANRRWHLMVRRCSDPSDPDFKHYGGRGISVHPAWLDFEVFYAYIGDPPTLKHTLDRIDNDGDYEPENVRWATPQEQRANRRPIRDNHCIRGHDLTDPQHVGFEGGRRRCRTCRAAQERERIRARRAAS